MTAKADCLFQQRGTIVHVAKNHVLMDIRAVQIKKYYNTQLEIDLIITRADLDMVVKEKLLSLLEIEP